MQWRALNLYSIDLSNGETEDNVLIAIAVASWLLAEPIDNDQASENCTISVAEARKHVSDRSVSMLFAKGRMCMTHVKVVDSGSDRMLVKFEMYEGNIERLMLLVNDVLDRLVPARQEEEIDVDIDMSPFDLEVESTVTHTLPLIASATA